MGTAARSPSSMAVVKRACLIRSSETVKEMTGGIRPI
jgi:hypothetical protein